MTPDNRQHHPDAGWQFDNSYAKLPAAFHARLNPVSVRAPKLVVFNAALAQFLGLNRDALEGEEGAAVFSGNRIPEGAEPLAQAYAGLPSADLILITHERDLAARCGRIVHLEDGRISEHGMAATVTASVAGE